MNLCALDRSMIGAASLKVAIAGSIGAALGCLHGVICKTDKKLAVIAYAIFLMSSVIISSAVHQTVINQWGGRPKYYLEWLCKASALWNAVEGAIGILAFRKLGLIDIKGTILMTAIYGIIVAYKTLGAVMKDYRENYIHDVAFLTLWDTGNSIQPSTEYNDFIDFFSDEE